MEGFPGLITVARWSVKLEARRVPFHWYFSPWGGGGNIGTGGGGGPCRPDNKAGDLTAERNDPGRVTVHDGRMDADPPPISELQDFRNKYACMAPPACSPETPRSHVRAKMPNSGMGRRLRSGRASW